LLWFHPLAWRMRKAHLTACEMVCDAVSAGFVGDVNEYCGTLARVAVATYESHPAAGIAMAKLSTISRRLNVLKRHVFLMPLRRRTTIGFGITSLLVVAVLGIMQFVAAAPPVSDTVSSADKKVSKTGTTLSDTDLRDTKDVQYESRGDLHITTIHELSTTGVANRYLNFPRAKMQWSHHERGKSGYLYFDAYQGQRMSWKFALSSNKEIKDFDEKPLKTEFYGANSPNRKKIFGNDDKNAILVKVGQIVLAHTEDDPSTIYILKIEKQSPDEEELLIKYVEIETNLKDKSDETASKPAENASKANKIETKSDKTQEKKSNTPVKTIALHVRIVDETAKPISDAKIVAEARRKEYQFTTDAEGKATVEVPASDINNLWLKIHAEGHVPIMWWNPLKDKQLPPETTFTMEPAQTVGGLIRDEQGNPIKDVQVELLQQAGAGMYHGLEPYPKTDAEGRWTYNYAPKNFEKTRFVLSHPEYIEEGLHAPSAMLQKQMQDRTAVMVMKKGTAVSGTITGPDGKPIANALVAQGADRYSSSADRTTRTDKEGHYRLTLVSANNNVITVVSPSLAPALHQVDPGQKLDAVDFHLEMGDTIKLRVVDKDNKPISGVNISPDTWLGYRSLPSDAGIAGKTDKDGRWSWTWAPKEAVEMSVYKSGYMNIRNVKCLPQENEYAIALDKPLTITGKVIDAQTKKIIPNIRIIHGYYPEGSNDNRIVFWERHEVLESNDGQFKVVSTFPSKAHFVGIEAEGYNPGVSRAFKDDEGDVTYDFALSKGNDFKVTVLLPDGKPAAGADVKLCPSPPGKFYNMATFIKNGRFLDYSDPSSKLKVAEDGLLSIPPQDNDYLLIIIHDQGFAKTTSQDLKSKPEIRLQGWGRLEGMVRQGTNPLSKVKLDIGERGSYDPKWSFLNFQDATETDSEGKFFYPKLLPGKWWVRVLPGNKLEITALFPREKIVDITAGQTTSVTFGGEGRPVIGKIQWPDAKAPDGDLSKIGASLCTKLPERPKAPKEIIDQGPDAYRQWNTTWEGTDEGKAWLKAAQNAGCGVGVQVKSDSSFRFEGVMPGKYEMSVSLVKADADNMPWEFPETLRYKADCIVPDVQGGVNDEPLDLGLVQLKDESGKELPTTPVKMPGPQAPGEKTVGTMADHFELLRYVIATNKENTQKIKTWQGKANVDSRSIFVHSGTKTGSNYSDVVEFVFDRSKKSIRWNNTLNKYSRINDGVDDPLPVPQIINGMFTPEAFYRYGSYGSPGNPATQKLNLWIHSFPRERINRYQFDFNPLYYLETERRAVAKDISGYMKLIDQQGFTGIKITREGDNVTIDFSLRGNTQYYTVSLSQGCNPIHMETKDPTSTWVYHWTYENIDGIWLPKTWTESVHQKDQRDEERKVTFVDNVVNRPVDAGAFSLPSLGVKPGDNVQDRRIDPPRQYNYEEEK
jgi:protocatechuate 3,4-dioxygenase beta subunit